MDQKLQQVQDVQTQWHQTHRVLQQRLAQLDQLVTQVQGLQTHRDQQPAGDSTPIRQRLAPLMGEIRSIQQRLHRLELGTAPQVGDLTAHLARLQTQVDHLVQGVVLRQGVGVFIDGANLHASARKLGVDLDYATLLPRLLPKNSPRTIHFYSGYDPDNLQQRRLHRDLEEQMGMRMCTKSITRLADGNTKANRDGQMIVDIVKSPFAHVFLLSGDGDFLPALETLQQQGVQITVAAFAPYTPWALQKKFRFRDLSKICAVPGRVVPLPVKQTAVG